MDNTIVLGRSGVCVPRLGLGAAALGRPRGIAAWRVVRRSQSAHDASAEEARTLEASLAAGVNFLDTEFHGRGASEQRVGELTRGRDVLIAAQFPPYLSSPLSDFGDALNASLRRLQRDSIDLFQHHYPSKRMPIPALMNLMADAVEAGKIRAVGVSNYSAVQMRFAHSMLARRGIPLASNQVEYSLLHRQPETDGVLEACRELGVTLIARSPLAGGVLSDNSLMSHPKSRVYKRLASGRLQRITPDVLEPLVESLREIAARYSVTPSQVALRWLLEEDGVLPIPAALNAEQAESNAGALSFGLTPQEVGMLSAATLQWRG
jgi:aryl-alcohol dehydrogenase-like predicted oxidoreductase